jgi:hypothetical protein
MGAKLWTFCTVWGYLKNPNNILPLQVNLFNAVYLIFFLVFIVSPGRAARYWGGLVIYCEFVILCIYMYYFSVLKGTRPCTGVSIEVGASKISFIFFRLIDVFVYGSCGKKCGKRPFLSPRKFPRSRTFIHERKGMEFWLR